MKLLLGLTLVLASAPVLAQSSAVAAESAPMNPTVVTTAAMGPAAQDPMATQNPMAAPAVAGTSSAKAEARKSALIISTGVVLGALALSSMDESDDEPSSP